MRRWGKSATAALLAISIAGSAWMGHSTAAVQPSIGIILDDVPLTLGAKPLIKNNVTMVPFRALANALGITVTWDAKTKSIIAIGEVNGATKKVILVVGKKTALVNGAVVALGAAPLVVDQQTLIPLSFFGTQFGAQVGWSKATNLINIVSPKKKMHLRAFYALNSYSQRARIATMDSVVFGWGHLDENGELVLAGGDFNWPEPAGDITAESLIKSSADQGAKPYFMVFSGDDKGELTKMLSDETLRNNSIDKLVQLATDKGFQGIMLDFEGLGWKLDPIAQQKLLNDYVRLLDPKLEAIGVQLSLAVPPPNSDYKGYDYKTLATYADDLVVMAHDYQGPNVVSTTPQPIDRVEQAIKMTLSAGVKADQIILGIDLNSESTTTVDDKLGLAKRYGLKGASFWRLTFFSDAYAEAIGKVVERVGE
jgi:hypothetical protein